MNLTKGAFLLTALLFCFAPLSAQKADAKLLAKAYKDNDLQKLTQFCKNWQSELPPITDEEISTLGDTVREAYQLFSQFFALRYKHENFLNLRFPNRSESFFAIVQNSLKVFTTDEKIYYSQREIDSFILVQVSAPLPDSLKNLPYSSDQELDSLLVRSCLWCKEGSSSLAILRTYRDNYSPYRNQNYQKSGHLVENIMDFRPQLDNKTQWLYWCKSKYEQILTLTDNSSKKQRANPANAVDVVKFLRSVIVSLPVTVRAQNTPPLVYYQFPQTLNHIPSIIFDKKMEYALVTSDYGAMHEEKEVWHRENGYWRFVEVISRMVGVE